MSERLSPFPSQDTLSDTEIWEFLREAGQDDEQQLRELFTPPATAASARIERLVEDNPSIIQQAALEHPVFDVPYVNIPPDVNLPLPADASTVPQYVDTYRQYRDTSLLPEERLPWFEKALLEKIEQGFDQARWEEYRETYLIMQLGNCSLKDAVFNSLRWFDDTRDIHRTEQYYFDNHLTTRHPTSTYRFTESYPVRIPNYMDMGVDSKRLAQAVGIFVDLLYADPYLQMESDHLDTAETDFLLKRTLRAHDREAPTEVAKRSYIESATRAVAPMQVEASRFDGEKDDTTLALVTAKAIPTKITRLAPLGYSGPAAVYGVALEGDVTTLTDSGLALSSSAISHLESMTHFCNRFFHYENLRKQREAEIKGVAIPEMLRTGLGCPVRTSLRTDSELILTPINAFQEVIFLIYETLKNHPSSPDTISSDYQPKGPREYAQKLYEATPSLATIEARNYRGLGKQAAQDILQRTV